MTTRSAGRSGIGVVLGRALPWCLGMALFACSRNHIEAVNLANEGEEAKKSGDLEGAISKFEQASRVDPDNHRILHKLLLGYRKKEEWEKVAAVAAKAEAADERQNKKRTFANYPFERGYALSRLADKQKGSWADARAPLELCIQMDPQHAEGYFALAEVLLHLDDEQGALQNYTMAVQKKPDSLGFYVPLGDLYVRLSLLDQAEQVLKEALSFAKEGDKHLFAIHTMTGVVAERRGNQAQAVASYEAAKKSCGACDDHREAFFNLGAAYFAATPPRTAEASQQLLAFQKGTCKGTPKQGYMELCAQTSEMLRKLGVAQ